MRRFVVWFAVVGLVADRILKAYAQGLPEGTAFSFFPGLQFGYFLNPALFFFPAWRWIPWVALVVLAILLGFWVLNLFRISSASWWIGFRISRPATLAVLFGGASNVFDRFAYGGVIDYMNIFGLATINLADTLIFAGLLILIFQFSGKIS